MQRRPVLGLLAVMLVALATPFVAIPQASAVDRDCSDFPSQRAAQIFFLNHGGPRFDPHRLDSDGDGIACEWNPPPYYYGTTPPGGGGSNPPRPTAVKSTVQLTLDPGKRITGEKYRMKVTVRPAISRKVIIQRKLNGRWKVFGSRVTNKYGTTSGTFKAPKTKATYRAVVKTVTKGNKKYSAATSKTRILTILRQSVRLSFNKKVVPEGKRVKARVHATPVRSGRPVVLQRKSSGRWETVRSGKLNKNGVVTFTVAAALGHRSYRAVVRPYRGAVPANSRTKRVTGKDVTPPAAPFGLVAVPGDQSVLLSWSRSLPSDFAHHKVWMRTAETGWSVVATTQEAQVTIAPLENGTTYWFAVTSVDTSGNASAMSSEVSTTPAVPAPRQSHHLTIR